MYSINFTVTEQTHHETAAQAVCRYIPNLGKIVIDDFYVLEEYKDYGLSSAMLQDIKKCAIENDAKCIEYIPGGSTYCPEDKVPYVEPIDWFIKEGFICEDGALTNSKKLIYMF